MKAPQLEETESGRIEEVVEKDVNTARPEKPSVTWDDPVDTIIETLSAPPTVQPESQDAGIAKSSD